MESSPSASLAAPLLRTSADAQQILDTASDAFVATDESGRVRAWNQAAEAMFGYSRAEATGRTVTELIIPEQYRALHTDGMHRFVQTGLPRVMGEHSEYEALRRSGDLFPIEITHWWIKSDSTYTFYAFIRDISERKNSESELAHRRVREVELRHRVLHDELTGLPNRTLGLEHLTHALARRERYGGDLAVLFVDLDRFKLVNDSLGHAAGDQLLRGTADRLRAAVRSADIVARVAGDEFVVICDELSGPDEVLLIAERILTALRPAVSLAGERVRIQGSVGIAYAGKAGDGAGDTAENLMRDADAAMYRAKERGRGQIAVFDDEMRERLLNRIQVERELAECLDRRELVLHHQPVVSLTDESIVAMRQVVYWQHPRLGLINPSQFVSLAEETGTVLSICDWAMLEACRQLRYWQQQGADTLLAHANLPHRYIVSVGFIDTLTSILAETGLSAESLELGVFVPSPDDEDGYAAVVRSVHELKDLGVSLAIAGFGAGSAALDFLRDADLDAMYLSPVFGPGIDTDRRNQVLVRSAAAMGHELGLTVSIDGISTAAERACAVALGCDTAQGDYFGKPMPADDAGAW